MLKVVITEYSPDSLDDALARAMAKAARYLNVEHDVTISVAELAEVPGRGFRATVEVTVVPVSQKKRPKVTPEDVEREREHDRLFRKMRKHEERHPGEVVHEHFVEAMGNWFPEIPDYYVSQATDAVLANKDIEKRFFRAAHGGPAGSHDEIPAPEEGTPDLKDVLGTPPAPRRD